MYVSRTSALFLNTRWDCNYTGWTSACGKSGVASWFFSIFGDFSRRSSSKICERKYCPSSRFMVAPLLFLISMASFTHLLYLFCSALMTFALSHPMTWFFSTTWSVTADLWTNDSDCFLLALATTDLLKQEGPDIRHHWTDHCRITSKFWYGLKENTLVYTPNGVCSNLHM